MQKHEMYENAEETEAFLNKTEILFKFLVLGDYGVGKTSIVRRYAQGTFNPTYKITIGADFAVKSIDWNENTRINLQLWDIAGIERFDALTSVYYRHAVAAAVVFDLTRPDTLNSLEKWLKDLRAKTSLSCGSDIPVVLLANKADLILPRNLDLDEFCRTHGIVENYLTSASENINIDNAMHKLLKMAYRNYYNRSPSRQNSATARIQLNNSHNQLPTRRCCY